MATIHGGTGGWRVVGLETPARAGPLPSAGAPLPVELAGFDELLSPLTLLEATVDADAAEFVDRVDAEPSEPR